MGFEVFVLILAIAGLLVWFYQGSWSPSRQRIRVEGEWRSYTIDRLRRGVSNGGMFVHRLAMEEPQSLPGLPCCLPGPATGVRMSSLEPPTPMSWYLRLTIRSCPWDGGRHDCHGPWARRMEFEQPRVEVRALPIRHRLAVRQCVSRGIDGWGHQWRRWNTDGGSFDLADLIFEFFNRVRAADAADTRRVRVQPNTRRVAARGNQTSSG